MKYKIGTRVKTDMLDEEGVVIATDDRNDEFSKVKVKFDGIFGRKKWHFESMLNEIFIK